MEASAQLVAEVAAHLRDEGSEAAEEQAKRGQALVAAWQGQPIPRAPCLGKTW